MREAYDVPMAKIQAIEGWALRSIGRRKSPRPRPAARELAARLAES